jgi:hypothetical protein
MDKFLLSCLICFLPLLAVSGCGYGFRNEGGKPALVSWTGNGRTVRYVEGADADTFRALDNADNAEALYAADDKRVYIGKNNHSMPIESADPASFSILTPDGAYTADKQRVYWYGIELRGANPDTFRILKNPYGVDATRAYVGITPLEVHAVNDFEVLEVSGFNRPISVRSSRLVVEDPDEAHVSGWSRDGVSYYWGATELEGADYDSLVVLNECHAKDKRRVYYKGKPIPSADVETFVTVGPGDISGRDKNYEYEKGQAVGRAK